MKFRGIQRAVRAQRFDRSAGDAPSLGRVARVHGTRMPKGERRRRRRGESGRGDRERRKRRLVILTWSAVFVLIALGMLVTALVLGLRPKMRHDVVAGGEDVALERRVVSQFESPGEEEALSLVKGALAVRDPGEVPGFFRLGAASPQAVVEFLESMESVDGAIDGYSWLSSMDANGLLIDGVLVKTLKGGKVRNRLALLTPDETGRWRVDFEALARTVRPSWDELLGQTGGEGLVRVIVAADSYYNGPFNDDSQWACYGMVSPDTDVVMLGYCRKNSPQEKALARIVSDADRLGGTAEQPVMRSPKRATLTIRRVEGAESRQFEILRVMAEDWVMAAEPFDGNFR